MYKFQNLKEPIKYSLSQKLLADRLNRQTTNVWDKSLTENSDFATSAGARRDDLKVDIKTKLHALQGDFCIYCGSYFNSVSGTHREHIIPKEIYKEFTFEPYNLVLGCQRCNIDLKGRKNYILTYNSNYELCTFSIIHPYLDELDEHLDTSGIIITIVNNSSKGQMTRDEFKLNNEDLLALRGLLLSHKVSLSNSEQRLLDEILDNTYTV